MADVPVEESDTEPVVSCSLQGGTLSVSEDRVVIDRSSASMFDDKAIPFEDVRGVVYADGLLTGHIQIRQVGVEHAEGGLFSKPVDENTLYFPRGSRSCARRARDAIRQRAATD